MYGLIIGDDLDTAVRVGFVNCCRQTGYWKTSTEDEYFCITDITTVSICLGVADDQARKVGFDLQGDPVRCYGEVHGSGNITLAAYRY